MSSTQFRLLKSHTKNHTQFCIFTLPISYYHYMENKNISFYYRWRTKLINDILNKLDWNSIMLHINKENLRYNNLPITRDVIIDIFENELTEIIDCVVKTKKNSEKSTDFFTYSIVLQGDIISIDVRYTPVKAFHEVGVDLQFYNEILKKFDK